MPTRRKRAGASAETGKKGKARKEAPAVDSAAFEELAETVNSIHETANALAEHLIPGFGAEEEEDEEEGEEEDED